jgi:hypothetical protein
VTTRAVDEALTRQRVSLLLLGLAAAVPPSRVDAGPVVCPVRRVTGRRCPGCGATRSLVRLVHGDPRGAAAAHPLGPALGVLLLAWAVTGRRSAGSPLDPRRWGSRPALLAVAGGCWALWALRRARH